jgi:ATP phosphoribosyltransferase
MQTQRLRIAIQKSGRLADKSYALLARCGIDFELQKDRLFQSAANFPIDLMLVRDDDIPGLVAEGVCDLGVVGENVLREKYYDRRGTERRAVTMIQSLNFGKCRLSLAVPETRPYSGPSSLAGCRIATSYPNCLQAFLARYDIKATIVELSGSVEIAPSLGVADAVCDLVSTGSTLRNNGLIEAEALYSSEAWLVRAAVSGRAGNEDIIDRFLQRVRGVLTAGQSKYIMMNAPKCALPAIFAILPGLEEPSVIPLGLDSSKVAIHAVAREDVFWETMERLKDVGASSILVLPIEKVIA